MESWPDGRLFLLDVQALLKLDRITALPLVFRMLTHSLAFGCWIAALLAFGYTNALDCG